LLTVVDSGSSQLSCFEREIANEVMLNSMLELIEIPVLDDILQYISSTIGSDVGKGSIPFELSSSTLLDEDDWWQVEVLILCF
jgi:hypothetical protein